MAETTNPAGSSREAYAMSIAAALEACKSSSEGLRSVEVAARRERHGHNALPEKKPTSPFVIFLRQFASPLIYLLFAAAAMAFFLGERTDGSVILAVVFINAIVGAFQEGRAERSMALLLGLSTPNARVIRDGQEQIVQARELVPGDIIVLGAGDAVPADARLLEAVELEVAEAALTGESLPVAKVSETVWPSETPLADRTNMLFSGTLVTGGRARALITAIGQSAEVGKVVQLAEQASGGQTPLERRVQQLGRYLLVAGLGAFVLVMLVGWWRGLVMAEVLLIGISQLVSIIPEGLPVAMTVALAVGMQRMAARGAVVRRLAAVESLGSTNVICSDKTGTLTRNEMTVSAAHLADHRALEVSGTGYGPEGHVHHESRRMLATEDENLRRLCEALVLCNDAAIKIEDGGQLKVVGDPTEAALLTFAGKAGIDAAQLRAKYPRTGELPFDARTKMMATQHGERIVVKGAPEAILELCGAVRGSSEQVMDEKTRSAFQQAARSLAARALRVLAVAELESTSGRVSDGWESLQGKPTLLGLVGQMDPPRQEVSDAVAKCKSAGVRTVMITGDHKATGLAIARALGIATDSHLALDQTELSLLDDDQLAAKVDRIAVFARVQPSEKLRIVDAYRARGNVVAMTGDGVNDAPALARADVGVAMGISGTDAAKQAAEIVLTDDNFTTIVSAIEEGRIVYQNIKKVVLLLLSTGLAELLVLLLAMLLGFPPPFVAVQILWNNVVTEGTVTINLTMDPASGDEMQRPPIAFGARLLDRAALWRLASMSLTITAVTLGFFAWRTAAGADFAQTRTATFTLLAVCEWFNVLNCRSETRSAVTLDVLRNRWLVGGLALSSLLQAAVVFIPALNRVFHTVPLPLSEVLLLGVIGSVVMWVEELRKYAVRRLRRLA